MMTERRPFLVEQFLRETGFPDPGPERVGNLVTALLYFHQYASDRIHQPADRLEIGPSPWSFAAGGRVTYLSAWIQAINLERAVTRRTLMPGEKLRMFKYPSFKHGSPARGSWATTADTPARVLALPVGQHVPHDYEVAKTIYSLESIAGDIFVDWTMKDKSSKYWYRHGAGVQFFIPDASALTPI
jgi:hypothetical protein